MIAIDEYLKGILGQILASYKILAELNDEPKDLLTIKKELSKIRGLLLVLSNKLDDKKYQQDHLVSLFKLSTYYVDTYDFTWEIEKLLIVKFPICCTQRVVKLLSRSTSINCRIDTPFLKIW